MRNVVYDAAVLVAADRNDRKTWLDHMSRVRSGVVVDVSAPVVAQVSRSSRQAQLRRFLATCSIAPFGEQEAHEAGRLLSVAGTADVVDAAVVTLALVRNATILTGDREDRARLVAASGRPVPIAAV